MNTLGVGLTALGQCREGLARLEEALTIAEEVGSAEEVSRGYINLSDGLSLCGRDVQAAERVTEGIAVVDRIGATGSYGPLIRDNGSRSTVPPQADGRWPRGRCAWSRPRMSGPAGRAHLPPDPYDQPERRARRTGRGRRPPRPMPAAAARRPARRGPASRANT